LWTAAVTAQKTTPAAAGETVVSLSARPMLAVARMLVDDTWDPLLDERIQQSPAARSVGAAWKPSDPRWQKARAALGARKTRLFEAYAKSPEIANKLREEIGRIGAGPDLDAAIAALKGPAGPAIVRQQAQMTYVVHASTAGGPNRKGPEIGSAEWNAQLRDMQRRFDERAGSDIPAADAARKADVEKIYAARTLSEVLRRVWDAGVSTAERQLNTGLNLMVFDDQAAIERDVAAAIGGEPAPAGAGTKAAPATAFPLEPMATCKDSWMEWGADDTRAGAYRESFLAQFKQNDNQPFFVPVSSVMVMGMKVLRVYSNTIGMARGFSITVDAPFDVAKKAMEKSIGQPLKKCETGEGMRTCELSIAEQKTVMLLGDATGREKSTLVGCFYFYEK
jgi:hypothetical protein